MGRRWMCSSVPCIYIENHFTCTFVYMTGYCKLVVQYFCNLHDVIDDDVW